MADLIITQVAGTEDIGRESNKTNIIDLGDAGYIESVSIHDTDNIQLIFSNKVVRIQIR